HAEMAPTKPGEASPWPPREWTNRAVVSRLPTSTTNMTGFLIWWRGSSLRKLDATAWRTIAGSNSGRDFWVPRLPSSFARSRGRVAFFEPVRRGVEEEAEGRSGGSLGASLVFVSLMGKAPLRGPCGSAVRTAVHDQVLDDGAERE